MAGLLRLIAIIAAALVVFGWSSVSADMIDPEFQLEAGARKFRIETYRYFRNNRTVYDRRIRGSEELLERWRERGASEHEAQNLLQWFSQATRATQQRVGLPGLPAHRNPMVEPGSAMNHIAQTPSDILLEAMPDVEGVKLERARHRVVPQDAWVAKSTQRDFAEVDERVAAPDRVHSPAPLVSQDATANSVQPVPRFPWKLPVEPRNVAKSDHRNQAKTELQETAATVDILPEPEATDSRNNTDARTVSVATETPASINMEMLASRIAEHNRSIRSTENQLRRETGWTLRLLEDVSARINGVLERQDIWEIYWGVLDTSDQDNLGHVESLDQCFTLFQQRLFEVQVSSEEEPTEPDFRREQRFQVLEEGMQQWQNR